ncbi:MAG: bifunctional (p)ppGpp synthetase/guanosine-3',5'-bis(diphosphate) 3'-pyrophosphohydrolase [Rhodocyclaceae bacterium]
MVSVTHSVPDAGPTAETLRLLGEALDERGQALVSQALAIAWPRYEGKLLATGEDVRQHALGMALVAASLKLDAEARAAALLFAAADFENADEPPLAARLGPGVARLVAGLGRLKTLRLATRLPEGGRAPALRQQNEILRKMLLALVEDIRVVLLRLASRTQTLRFLADRPGQARSEIARESLDLYAPLANRLGVWQLKWEMEDLSFRFLEPQTYQRIARMLDERRIERERFIARAIERLAGELAAAGIRAEVHGRPKHIYSIWNKMRSKGLDFSEVYDIRALRVLVEDVKDCYAALSVVHHIWQPIEGEFDDYIAHPKGNDYRSLHTAVRAADGRALEVQIRTHEMHRHAELGIAAHWRYKEAGAGARADSAYDEKIALLRSLLSWRDELAGSAAWATQLQRAALDDTIYVVTPQGRVIDLPRGATPVDFAYRVHSELGHRCRGARVDGRLVPLDTPLSSGQRVEVIAAKQGGPSRDWLQPQLRYLVTAHARAKVRRWFAEREEQETIARGRAIIAREMQREGATQANIDELARRLGHAGADALYLAAGRDEVGAMQLRSALRGGGPAAEPAAPAPVRASAGGQSKGDILIVGVDKLLTQLGRCCKPVPPDAISGFVTRGRGVSIHRSDCRSFALLAARSPERVIEAAWGEARDAIYPVDIVVEAQDRQGLLRDVSEILAREKVNVTAANTQSRTGMARMSFTVEVDGLARLNKLFDAIRELKSVLAVRRT